jgi:hypothetical protein
MSQSPNIRRNLEAGQIYIPLWVNGLHVNRSPLFTPISAMGVQIISRFDTLWGGSNMELSMQNTITRRPGYPQYCNVAFNASEWPLQFFSYRNLTGSITTLVDTQTNIYTFTPSAKTSISSKLPTAAQTAFQRVGQALYMANFASFQATGDAGTVSAATVRPVGLAVPTVAPSFTLGTHGFLVPSVGFSFGYSYADSVSGHVSTMSPISASVGDLNVTEVSESSVTYPIAAWSAGSGTVVFGTPGGNNLHIGQSVNITGLPGLITPVVVGFGTVSGRPSGIYVSGNQVGQFPVGAQINVVGCSAGALNGVHTISASFLQTYNGATVTEVNFGFINTGAGSGGTVAIYPFPPISSWVAVVTAVTSSSFSASTTSWGSSYSAASFSSTPLNGCNGVLSPITIPASPYVYTVNQASVFSPTNAFGLVKPSPMIVKGPNGSPVYTQIASGMPTTGQYVVNAGTGAITFAAADTGNVINLQYATTPATGGTPTSFILTGPATNNSFSGGTQTDITGYAFADSLIIYRSQDSDTTAGPWYFLAAIPNNLAISSAAFAAGGTTTIYTLTNPCPAGTNNGFAGATGTGGATIAGFSNAGNNGVFDIIASTSTTITCTNSGGVNETAAATVNSGTWTYTDTGAVFGYAFDLTIPDGELDILIEAPINLENNPPPNVTNPITTSVTGTFSLLCFGAGRMWGAVNNYVYFAGGPDVTFGNGNESWPPANVFTFPGAVIALASVPAGIIVFTSDEMWMIYGTSTSTFYAQIYQKNLGVASQNCLVLDGDTLYVYSNQGQLWSFTNSLTEIGLNVAPLLGLYFPPATTYLAMHKNGADVGLHISDGSTNYIRFRIDENSWSPMCQIVGGSNCFQSIETSLGQFTLLVGAATGSGFIAGRSLTTWTDIGGTYPCYAIVGSLTVAPPGTTALVDYLTLQYVPTGTAPTVAILPQDFATLAGAGTFTSLGAGVNDPPKLLPTGSTNMTQKRWYLKNAASPIAQEMCNVQIKISFPAENYKAEILTLGVT